jgi:branched-chain amino acid transport system ATP-binding protein
MLSIENLHSAYGEAHVLNGISMQVKPGEIVAILGRNGMGKTSLVRSIMNLSFPQKVSGTVSLSGTDITKLAPYKISANGLGYVPQGRRLFESLTVLEHLKILETTDSNAWSVERAFKEFPRLEERKFHRGNQLSGGERQMLAIARALMTGPKILLMDEPTEGLAPVMVELVEEILKKLKNDGLGILLVEQNFYSAMEVADRVYIIETGNVVWEGLPVDLLQNEELQQQFLGIH